MSLNKAAARYFNFFLGPGAVNRDHIPNLPAEVLIPEPFGRGIERSVTRHSEGAYEPSISLPPSMRRTMGGNSQFR